MFALFSVELVSGIVIGIGMFIGATAIPFTLKYLYKKAKTTLRNGNGSILWVLFIHLLGVTLHFVAQLLLLPLIAVFVPLLHTNPMPINLRIETPQFSIDCNEKTLKQYHHLKNEYTK